MIAINRARERDPNLAPDFNVNCVESVLPSWSRHRIKVSSHRQVCTLPVELEVQFWVWISEFVAGMVPPVLRDEDGVPCDGVVVVAACHVDWYRPLSVVIIQGASEVIWCRVGLRKSKFEVVFDVKDVVEGVHRTANYQLGPLGLISEVAHSEENRAQAAGISETCSSRGSAVTLILDGQNVR